MITYGLAGHVGAHTAVGDGVGGQSEFEGKSCHSPVFVVAGVDEGAVFLESAKLIIPFGQISPEIVTIFEERSQTSITGLLDVKRMGIVV